MQILRIIIKGQKQNIVCLAGAVNVDIDRNTNETKVDIFTTDYSCQYYYKLLIYPVSIAFTKDDDEIGSHSNELIIDAENKTIELFEPSGGADWSPYIAEKIKQEFSLALPDYQFKQLNEFCLKVMWAGRGVCGSSSLLLLLLVIYNNKLRTEDIILYLSRLGQYELTNIMRTFICYIDDLASKYGLYALKKLFDSLYAYLEMVDRNLINNLFEVYDKTADVQDLINFAIQHKILFK